MPAHKKVPIMLSQAQLGANRMHSQKVHRPHFPRGRSRLLAQRPKCGILPSPGETRRLTQQLALFRQSALPPANGPHVSNESHESSSKSGGLGNRTSGPGTPDTTQPSLVPFKAASSLNAQNPA